MGYSLGNVKPHVRAAAEYFGPRHRISTIGGYRANGSVPNSDHPKGLALDYMTRSKSNGDGLATDLVRNAAAWNVKYVIWWREIWEPGRGWRPYTLSNPHTDHVHASFKANGKAPSNPSGGVAGTIAAGAEHIAGGAGSVLDPLGVAGAINKVGDKLGDLAESAAQIGKVGELLTRAFLPTSIVRGSAALGGTLCILIGIYFLSREIRNS